MKNLTLRAGVHLTPSISRTIELMDKFFEGEPSEVTSGLRTQEGQLGIIIQKLIRHKRDAEFKEFVTGVEKRSHPADTVHVEELGRDLFWWQRAWSRLLHMGDIVNPPMPAEVLFDYYRPGSTNNKKGEIIQISPHQRGLAFDIGGGDDLIAKSKCVVKAVESRECFIKSWLLEHVNNACHIDTLQVGGGTG